MKARTSFKKLAGCIFALIPLLTIAQFNPEKQALNKIKKGEWNSARKILNKSLHKDSLNTEANFVYSFLFSTRKYPLFNIDTANYYRIKAESHFKISDTRIRDRLKKFPIDSLILARHKFWIDSMAFEKAKDINSEASYIHFLKNFSNAIQIKDAIELRDESAFLTALKNNSETSFREFLEKYPKSHRAQEANHRFEKHQFENETKNKTLSEYKEFVKNRPSSAFTQVAIDQIFDLSTLDGLESSFENFIQQYPVSKKVKEATSLLFHISLSRQRLIPLNDSLKKIYPLREWIPFIENGKWGFMDESSMEVFKPVLNRIDDQYLCEPLKQDFINADTGIIARNGVIIQPGIFKSAFDLGFGFIIAESDTTMHLVHKSGKRLNIPNLEQAVVVDSQYIACRRGKFWGLYSFTGHPIIPFSFNSITARGRFIILSRSGKEILVEKNNILAYAQGKYDPVAADEIRRYGSKYFWVRNGSLEKIMDENLNEVIPFDRHQISFGPTGLIEAKNSLYFLRTWPGLNETPLESYEVLEPWLITHQKNEKPVLHFIPTQQIVVSDADSIWFDETFAGTLKNDTIKLFQSPTKSFIIPLHEKYTIRKAKDSVTFILTKLRNRTTIYLADNFQKILTTTWPEIEPIIENIFLIKDKGKQGLIDDRNSLILKPEYDGILYSEGEFTLLKDRKFGIYNPVSKELLKPSLESNPLAYNQQWLIGRKANKLGFIPANKMASKTTFEFEEITYWSDSIALVKINRQNAFFDINNKKIKMETIGSFQLINGLNSESLAIVSINKQYGLISARLGIVLEPAYLELTYLPVNGKLIFIGLKNLTSEQAELHYLNSEGKLIRKIVTDMNTAYSILCDN